ncbi:NUDIX domain-containing protein [Microbacterium sp. MYb45]|uniref:NUDIX domain-containing protein n=1 Tax=Microbacterium sp. MYb45 TaxID=1827294 RepID=UPI000CFE8794|nr:NUDIX hydrolase [Microbacterium sp. MYb45]PRB65677.1 NTP pyrophosphohydrolase [Microbacterium sp. MYb45]
MTVVPPAAGEPRRPEGPRDPGDAWVVAESGERYWGRFGAAGLLAYDPARGILLQHRVAWSHFGGTWGLPGGALHEGESAIVGAIREAQEEAGVPDGAVRPRFTSVLDLGIWSYTTVVADVRVPFEPVISDPESVALEWVPVEAVETLPLHPGFGAAWPALRALLEVRPVVVVDAANVVGSVPDGWWKDRAGAAERLRDELAGLTLPAADLELDGDRWFPDVSMVVEGQARGIESDSSMVAVVRAEAGGDDAIVAEVERRIAERRFVVGVTSDRGLRERVDRAGAHLVRSAGWLRDLIDRNS